MVDLALLEGFVDLFAGGDEKEGAEDEGEGGESCGVEDAEERDMGAGTREAHGKDTGVMCMFGVMMLRSGLRMMARDDVRGARLLVVKNAKYIMVGSRSTLK